MCKNLFKGLLGGGITAPTPAGAAQTPVAPTTTGATVVANTDTSGTTGTGRVKLGTSTRTRSDSVAGLSI